MSDAARIAVASALALGSALALVPVAIALARRTSFLDRPVGYKAHRVATPYLGGLAVVAAFLIASAIATDADSWLTLVTCVVLVCAVGTIDDRVNLPIGIRLAVQIGVAVALWTANTGWTLFDSDAANLVITVVWVVGIVNAFNLMDNQDGAAASVAASCGIGIAVISQIHGGTMNAVLGAAVAGACLGFLPYNLAKPSRIFLGDGGSMPIGLIIAALIMEGPWGAAGWEDLLVAAPMAGIPIFDTTLVVFSRSRRRAAVLSGARDHLTHRLLALMRTPARVAGVLALAQAALCGLAIGLSELGSEEVTVVALLYLAIGAAGVLVLDDTRLLAGAAAERAQVAEELS
jgi:UDP-GlcNAc:undecaprenyl-phosphate/decaprenyl-phosphate GlcNAc-1-phosphate transferase